MHGYNLEMNDFVLADRKLPWPVDWAELFGREAPLLLEIGFGGGQFLLDLAQKRPSCNIIGVEISVPSLQRGASKIKNHGVSNVRLMQCDARYLLHALCAPQSVDAVFINFPDPWRKAAHYHRRLLQDDFLALLATRMKPHGLLDIATDHADYAQWITERLERTPYFKSRLASTFVTEDKTRLQTKYELRGLALGHVCHYYKWQRNDTAVSPTYPIPKEYAMPHVIVKTPLSLPEIAAQFEPQHINDGMINVRFLEAFLAQNGRTLLIDTYISEEPMSQRLGVQIRQRDDGEIVIRLHEIGFPRSAEGLQIGVRGLADWVVGLHPDAVIVRHNLGMNRGAGEMRGWVRGNDLFLSLEKGTICQP